MVSSENLLNLLDLVVVAMDLLKTKVSCGFDYGQRGAEPLERACPDPKFSNLSLT